MTVIDLPPLAIPIWFMRKMRLHAAGTSGEEVCGLLAGTPAGMVSRCYPVENILHRADRFLMEPKAQFKVLMDLERRNLRLLAIYHSHPDGPAHPSETDLQEFYYPEAYSIIWSRSGAQWICRVFAMQAASFREVAFRKIATRQSITE